MIRKIEFSIYLTIGKIKTFHHHYENRQNNFYPKRIDEIFYLLFEIFSSYFMTLFLSTFIRDDECSKWWRSSKIKAPFELCQALNFQIIQKFFLFLLILLLFSLLFYDLLYCLILLLLLSSKKKNENIPKCVQKFLTLNICYHHQQTKHENRSKQTFHINLWWKMSLLISFWMFNLCDIEKN